MKIFLKFFFITLLSGVCFIKLAQAGSSITYYEVTLHFQEDTIVSGKFANGEPWIIGTLTVTGIDNPTLPISSTRKGGAMINPIPGGKQGFMPQLVATPEIPHPHGYDPALDVSRHYPFTVNVGDSLVVGRATEIENKAVLMESIVGFTFLATPPPEGSFRPGLYGTDRRVRFNVSDIDWSVLKNLPTVTATPTQDWMERDVKLPGLPLWEWGSGWESSSIRPLANSASGDGGGFRSNYGREIAFKWSTVALWLNTANTQAIKKRTLIHAIQSGIDIASYFDHGGSFNASGGHQVGFKFPMLLAAATLKDPDFISYASTYGKFVEDLTTFFVSQEDIKLEHGAPSDPLLGSADPKNYTAADYGLPEWGITHMWDPSKDDRRWRDGVPYRFAQWPSMTGQVLAAELMGLQKLWNHPPIFPYSERHTRLEGLSLPGVPSFEDEMWKAYKASNDLLRLPVVTITPNKGTFYSPETVTMTTPTAGTQIRYTLDGSMPDSTSRLYSSPFTVSSSQTIRATAVKAGMHDSELTTAILDFPLRLLSTKDWTLQFVDSDAGPENAGALAFDGDPKTVWHTEWQANQPPPPHEIQINLGARYSLDGFSYLPRQDGTFYGNVGRYEFYVSSDGMNWGRPVATGSFVKTSAEKEVRFPAKSGQYVRLRALSASDDGPFMNVAELGVSYVSSDPLPPPRPPTAPKAFRVVN